MKHRLLIAGSALVFLLCAPACSDDDGGGGGSDSPIPHDTVIADLDDEQVEYACNELEPSNSPTADEEHRLNCALVGVFEGIFAEDAVAACQAAFDGCLADPNAFSDDEFTETECLLEDSTCQATVGTLLRCAEEQANQLREFARNFDCETAIADAQAGNTTEPGPGCLALAEQCPEFFGGSLPGDGVMGGPKACILGDWSFQVTVTAQGVDRVEVEMRFGDMVETHPMVKDSEVVDRWEVELRAPSEYVAGESSAIDCDEALRELETTYRAYDSNGIQVGCQGPGC